MLMLASVVSAMAAANSVPTTYLGSATFAITPNDLKPPECASLNLTNIVIGSGTFSGTNGNDLILGSAGADNINAMGGDDCVVAGDGDDTIVGGTGNDVILAGPGNDTLAGNPGIDVCYGGPGTDSFNPTCETQIDP